ncbi:sterol carrier protein domain-containing protein [uncultured Fusobacterium sp.]|uniref:sterol carrier protein domain-containing protein n=1 Tax=uncultured Fusobacterium sp. TaxID=159267 RepID=UPI002805D438|nr:sterol carrier protein domain-containing protein [uncultured Fusobacterium sp.]
MNIKDINFKIKVNDSIISENNGVFSIDRSGNIEKLESEDKWNIDIDIRDLATLLSGYMSIDELLELEKIRIDNIDLKILRTIFKKEKNYIQEFQ